MLADHEVFSKGSEFISREIEDEVVLVPSPSSNSQIDSVYSINPCGAFIWNLLDGSHSVKAIIEAIVQEFDVALEIAASDVREFLGSLLAEGMIQSDNETRSSSGPPIEE